MSNPSLPTPARAPGDPSSPAAPSRVGYLLSVVVLVASLLFGGVLIAIGTEPDRPTPDFVAELEGQGSVTFEVGEGEESEWALFTTDPNVFSCFHVTPSGEYGETEIDTGYATDDGRWRMLRVLDTREPGTHTYLCDEESDASHGVASMDVVRGAETEQLVKAVVWLAVPALGTIAAIVIAVATAIRRGSARRRLAAAGATPARHD